MRTLRLPFFLSIPTPKQLLVVLVVGWTMPATAQLDAGRLHVYSLDVGSLFDHVNTSARFSYEYRTAKGWGWSVGMGYVYNLWNGRFRSDEWSSNKGVLPSFELRKYNYETDKHGVSQFYGIRFHYLESHLTKDFEFVNLNPPAGAPERISGPVYQYKQTYGAHLILGENIEKGKWLFELTAGLGIIHRTLNYPVPDGYDGPQRTNSLRQVISNNPFGGYWPSLYLQARIRLVKPAKGRAKD